MTTLIIILVSIAAIGVALALAFVPLRLAVAYIGSRVAAPIRDFIQRQRDRRRFARETPDRRNIP